MTGNRRIIIAAIAVATSACAAFAQQASRPAEQPSSRPQVTTPYWGQPDVGGPTIIAAQPAVGEQLLTTTVLAVPQASADATVARWTYRRIDRQLNQTADGLRRDFRDSDEYAAAVNDFNDAYATLESARVEATRGIVNTPEYQAAVSLRRSVGDQIADAHSDSDPDVNRLIALASLKLEYAAPIRSAEIEKLNGDSRVRDAKARLLTAARAIARLEKDFAKDVRDGIELAGIRKGRDDARIAMLASAQYLDEMRLARSIALNYAYVGQGFNPSYVGSNYGSGYNYGYSSYSGGFGAGYVGGFFRRSGNAFPVGFTGNSPFGAGTNAFTGRGGNAISGGAPSSANQGGDLNSNPGGVFGNGKPIPSPFGTGQLPGAFPR